MTEYRFDPNTKNDDVGPFITDSGRVVIDSPFGVGVMGLWIKATVGGYIVWINDLTGKIGEWPLEDGESMTIACTRILTSGEVNGVSRSTTAAGLFYGSCAQHLTGK